MRAQEFITQGLAEGAQPGKPVVDAILRVMPVAQQIWFHGSRATGRHRKHSDTDILVVVPDDIVGDQYLDVVRTLQKLNSDFDNYDIQPTKAGTNIQRIAQQEGRLLWSKPGVAEDAFHGIEITLQDLGDDMIQIEAHAAGRELGYVTFVQEGDTLLPQDLHVDERYRGQGIAAAMYDYAKSQGYKIRRSGQQTDAGAGFWAKHRPEQNVWEGNEFNQCFDQACKLYDQAVSKRLQPKLVQVADFQGDGSGADARWIKLPQHVWQHYVVIVGDQVLDPTATQFGDDMPTKYSVSDLDKLWAKQYQIRPRPDVVETVNRKGFERGFEQTKPYGDYVLKATPGYMPYIPGRVSRVSNFFRIEAYLGKSMVAWVNFEDQDGHLEAMDVHVEPRHRRKGIASAMYDFAKDIGNTIKPSPKQTALGREFSRQYNKPDVAEDRG